MTFWQNYRRVRSSVTYAVQRALARQRRALDKFYNDQIESMRKSKLDALDAMQQRSSIKIADNQKRDREEFNTKLKLKDKIIAQQARQIEEMQGAYKAYRAQESWFLGIIQDFSVDVEGTMIRAQDALRGVLKYQGKIDAYKRQKDKIAPEIEKKLRMLPQI